MVAIDLKPLTPETIAEMGYNNHDLWLVKISSVVFGPYETQSLKHYVADNEHLFETAEASRVDEKEWKPFWAHTKFQRRKLQVIQGKIHDGPFWLMDNGLKIGPFSFKEIDKKIEMGLLAMTDHVSIDEGLGWIKIFEIEGFDRRTHDPDELPLAPTEASFQKAKLALAEKHDHRLNTSDELAELAWCGHQQGKVIQMKLDEMTLRQTKNTEVSDKMIWAAPTAVAMIVSLMTAGYFYLGPSQNDVQIVEVKEEKTESISKRSSRRPVAEMPAPKRRFPSSVGYDRPAEPVADYESRYPTHTETHDQLDMEPMPEKDPIEAPVADAEEAPQEHSLVGNNTVAEEAPPEEASAEQPVVEEASDF